LTIDSQREVARLVAEWGTSLVRGWDRWIDLPVAVGDLLATRFLGASPGEVIVADTTTVNLYKLVSAAIDDRPGRRVMVTDADNFPTDRYVLEGIAEARGLELRFFEGDPVHGPDAKSLSSALVDDVAVVCLSHVAYRSGALADMPGLTALVTGAGAHCIWDLSHSVGAVPIDLHAAGVGLAVGCTYKYLNAGPGAPAFLYVGTDLQDRLRSPIWGWFGQREQFEMGPRYHPAVGITRFLSGTPDVVGLASIEGALQAFPDIAEASAKSEALTALAVELVDDWLVPLGCTLATPLDPTRRAAHVAVAHADAWAICRALIERTNVVPDFRAPNIVRFGFPPLYSRYVDVWDALDRTRQVLVRGWHHQVDTAPRRVT
jgi:kynureninase